MAYMATLINFNNRIANIYLSQLKFGAKKSQAIGCRFIFYFSSYYRADNFQLNIR